MPDTNPEQAIRKGVEVHFWVAEGCTLHDPFVPEELIIPKEPLKCIRCGNQRRRKGFPEDYGCFAYGKKFARHFYLGKAKYVTEHLKEKV